MVDLYHVAHSKSSKPYNDFPDLKLGDEIDVGSELNPFFSYFYKTDDHVKFFNNDKQYEIHYTSSLNALAKGTTVQGVEVPELSFNYLNAKFHDLDCLNRELLLENVRLEHYPDMPSRHTCLWVSQEPQESLEWLQHFVDLGALDLKLVCLETSDEPAKVDSMFLPLKSDSLSKKLEKAHDYWSGKTSERPMIEYLFKGKATVKFISPLHH